MPFDLHLLRPYWLLALIPLLVLLWRLWRRPSGAGLWRRVVDPHLLSHLLEGGGTGQSHLPLVLLGLGWVLTVVALAGPAWERLPQPVYQTDDSRVIALDISRSMNATDVQPSRLARARFEVLDMLERAVEGQTALLAYGAEPYIVSPLTTDAATIAAQVPNLESDLLPVQGAKRTDLALEQAGELLRRAGSLRGQVILVTDGLERPDDARRAARRLLNAGYRVSVLGVGTEKGAPIPLAAGGFQTDDQGAIELLRLEPNVLASVSDAGGGRYVAAIPADSDVVALIPAGGGEASRFAAEEDGRAERWREEGPWLLLALLPLAALGFRRGWLSPLLVLVLVAPPQPVLAFGWDDLWQRPDQRAARNFAAGDHAEAAERFRRPDWRAAARYEAGDYAGAVQALAGLNGAEAAYNRGNALARQGNYEEAIGEYERALSDVPGHEDARHNRDLLQRFLDAQQQQQSDSSQSRAGGSGSEADPAGDGEQGGDDQRPESEAGAAEDKAESAQSAGSQPQQGGTGLGDRDTGGSTEFSDSEGSGAPGQEPMAGPGSEQGSGGRTPVGEEPGRAEAQREAQDSGSNPASASPEAQTGGVRGPREDETEDGAVPPGTASQPGGSGAAPRPEDLLGSGEAAVRRGSAGEAASGDDENRQAMEHMLRRVPDDPGGLLRQRFLLQHLRRSGRLP
jgi:Ca-activated chloride channel family protein